jgi:Protein of unknown function (DUF4038)
MKKDLFDKIAAVLLLEIIPVGFYNSGASGIERSDDYDARQAAYWSLLAGACGHTYGNHSI